MNVAVAVWPPMSVATTVLPDVPLGTTNVQRNAPEPSVDNEPLTKLEIGTESKTSDVKVVDTEKPVPDTVTIDPTEPVTGLTVIEAMVTMNAPVAVWPLKSVAMTVVPDVRGGTANVQPNAPVAFAIKEPNVQAVISTPSKVSAVSSVDKEKPLPDTVTVAP